MDVITTKSRYGLRFLLELCRYPAGRLVDLGTISRDQGISELYLSKLAVPLKAAGIIRASRGAKGGFELARSPEAVSILQIVEALEGRSSLLECTADPGTCERSGDCATLPIWMGLDAAIKNYLRDITLAQAAGLVAEYAI